MWVMMMELLMVSVLSIPSFKDLLLFWSDCPCITTLRIVNVLFEKRSSELTLCPGCVLNGYESTGSRSLPCMPITAAQGYCILEMALSYWQLRSELKPPFHMFVKLGLFHSTLIHWVFWGPKLCNCIVHLLCFYLDPELILLNLFLLNTHRVFTMYLTVLGVRDSKMKDWDLDFRDVTYIFMYYLFFPALGPLKFPIHMSSCTLLINMLSRTGWCRAMQLEAAILLTADKPPPTSLPVICFASYEFS